MEHFRGEELEVRQARAEARREAEAREVAVAEQVASSRTLLEAVASLSERCGTVLVDVAGRRIAGQVVHIGDDLFSLSLDSGSAASKHLCYVVVSAMYGVRAESEKGSSASSGCGPVVTGYPGDAAALLRGAIVTGDVVEIGRVDGETMRGTIVAVAPGHVEGRDQRGARWLLPLAAVAWIESPDS